MKRRECAWAMALVALVALWLRPARADVVYLKDGGKLEGKITDQGDAIVVRMGSIKMTVEKDRILRIEEKKAPRDEYKEKLAALPADDADACYELGIWCLDRKLPTQARDCFTRALAIDPDHEEARRRLGHVLREGRWVKPCVKCTGTGKTDCPGCKGSGFVRELCPHCLKGKKTCEACGGQGFLLCQSCGGAGAFTCLACGGAGGQWVNEWMWVNGAYILQPIWRDCARCNGQGRIDCPDCSRGRVDCKRCKKGKYPCPSCDGRGEKRNPCQLCKGLKKVDCPVCNGKGHTDEGSPEKPRPETPPEVPAVK